VQARWWAHLELTDPDRGQIVRDCFLGPARAVPGATERSALVHIPAQAQALAITVYAEGGAASADPGNLSIEPLSRTATALQLLWFGRGKILGAIAGNAQGRLGRLRAVMGQAPARAGEAPPYETWIALFEPSLALAPPAPPLPHQIAIVGADSPARRATLQSISPTPGAVPPTFVPTVVAIETPEDWRRLTAPWIIILQAGEVLAAAAPAWFAHAAAIAPLATFITADCDTVNAETRRSAPLFKPSPDLRLLCTGLLTRGAACVRRELIGDDVPANADAARQLLAERNAAGLYHVARILSHLPASATPPPSAPAPISPGARKRVAAIIPTALRSPHVPECLGRIVQTTAYPAFRAHVVVSDPARANPSVFRRVRGLPRVNIIEAPQASFNYAAVNNAAAESLAHQADLLLLLNDDVAPISPQWLDAMVAQMRDPSVGIVGARLLYGNRMVQHEGVVMGLAHLCEHAGRLRRPGDPGPHGLGLLTREVSAVTAACLLIRASLFASLGGMDSAFAIALNDVDLCLRARAAGWRIVYCAEAVLYHYESLSLGHHYEGARASLEALEVTRLRELWGAVIADDPFYNPLASLEPGREWQPAFPPRDTGTIVRPANSAATRL
jgi:GT2 family glycosyltransferase